ncbi:MAG: hypothetical protein ACTSSP_10020 [Candidatus Asgardarchaeia archaeon]
MKVSDFKDKYKGRIAFLLGGGPSLHDVDIDLIKDHVIIAVNSGIVKYPNCYAFVSDDIGVKNWDYYTELLPTLDCVKFLYRDKLKDHCSHLDYVCLFSHTWWYSPKERHFNMKGLLLRDSEPIIGARTSMGSAVHLAYIMGCNPIVLLGNDCKFKSGKRYFWQYKGENKAQRIAGTKFNKRTQSIGFDQKAFVNYWNTFAKVNKDILGETVDIIDASESALKCFPKMNINEILDKYGEKK